MKIFVTLRSLPLFHWPRVILEAEANNGRPIVMHQRLGEFQYERVSRIKRDVHLATQDEILLCIVLTDTIDECGASEGVARVSTRTLTEFGREPLLLFSKIN